MSVPSNLVPLRLTEMEEYLGSNADGYLYYVLEGRFYQVQFSRINAIGQVPSSRRVDTGSGLQGGGDLAADRTLSIADGGVTFSKLADSGVTPSTYGASNSVPVIEVDAKGRVTGVVDTPIVLPDYVPDTRQIIAGAGLTGGGVLGGDVTLSLDPSNTTPLAVGTATAGVGTKAARYDHVHPAVNLASATQVGGVLPLNRGGTGAAISPAAGAVVYSTGTVFALTGVGSSGQLLASTGTSAPEWVDAPSGLDSFVLLTADEDISGQSVVHVKSNFHIVAADAASELKATGYIKTSVTNGDTVAVYLGGLFTGLTGLTGGDVYLGAGGAVTSTQPTPPDYEQVLGFALSSTEMIFSPQIPNTLTAY